MVSVLAEKEEVRALELRRLRARGALRRLGARISRHLHRPVGAGPQETLHRSPGCDGGRQAADERGEPVALRDFSGDAFEDLVCRVLQQELRPADIAIFQIKASRDNGIDAVAVDLDPIRGGRIIIQAKRRKAVVELQAVRELYGIVHSEGASKGILVTNAHFGAAAHRFIANKPISLIDGRMLRHLMKKHHISR